MTHPTQTAERLTTQSPSAVPPQQPKFWKRWAVSMLAVYPALIVLVLATRPLARWLRRPTVMRSLDALTGLALMGFGLRLALSRPTS